ncbi:hypothetical protein N7509_009551 [Penicillium cosmopolitanum]|uniref:BHLH domain-containing protein n=1 Tax=Penicillium cosmopolitanum TaxID=1131564 RepID=A0A9W9VPT3_9EURO|nr:uncharacterized protein N7509_009551 [Penicillium cosmopolitanum]KAJ5387010.1 hypothetical protein N7509_009551 [Penicillium cosmopolitanum]
MHTEHQTRDYSHENEACCPPDTKEQKRWPLETGLQWGSDPSFCYHGFSNPIGTWTEERVTQNLMRNMMHAANSVTVDFGYEFDFSTHTPNFFSEQPDIIRLNRFDLSNDLQTDIPTKTPSLRSASLSTAASLDASSPPEIIKEEKRPARQEEDLAPPKKKRKCVQKPGQQLCHCRSEKKRREAVTRGYQDLSDLVPGLKNHNFTRKYILDETAKYVSALLQGNEDLQGQLDQMKPHNEPDMWPLFEKEEDL